MTARRTAALGAFALAFGLRAGAAALTECRPIFPAYYYNDARINDAAARTVLAAWESHEGPLVIPRQTQGYALWLAVLYRTTTEAPFVPKLINALFGALSALVWGATGAVMFGRRAGLMTALLIAAWPSHVFFTSQNFKEAPVLLSLSIVIASWIFALRARAPAHRAAALACGALAMPLGCLIRPTLLSFYVIAAAAGAGTLLARCGRSALKTAAALLAAAVLGASLYISGERILRPDQQGPMDPGSPLPTAIESPEGDRPLVHPDSPVNISEYRRMRFELNRIWSMAETQREINTEFFPEARFETWLNIAAFLPKASFYELFMPLPGLYPLAGKPGRILAAFENLAVLLGFALAVAGFWRERRKPGAWVLAAFVVAVVPALALFEFDLGSASRHRLQPLAAAVPFVAAWATRAASRHRAR